MSFDIGKLYRQLSAKIRNSSNNNSNNTNNSKKSVLSNSKFLFNNYNNRPIVSNDKPNEAPVVKYAMPSPEPTPMPTADIYVDPEFDRNLKYAVPDFTKEPTPMPTADIYVNPEFDRNLKYAVPDFPEVDESVKKYAVPDFPEADESVKKYAVPDFPEVNESVKKYAVPDFEPTTEPTESKPSNSKEANPFESALSKILKKLRNLFK